MTIYYVITNPHFFKDLYCGQVAHFNGIVNGLKSNKVQVVVLTGLNSVRSFFQLYSNVVRNLNSGEIVLIRKNILNLLIIGGLSITSRGKWKLFWEVNGLTSERYSDAYFGRYLHRVSIFLHKLCLSGSRGVYVVTHQLKNDLTEGHFALASEKIIIVNNGIPTIFQVDKKSLCRENVKSTLNLLFFGKMQVYNDFNLILKLAEVSLLEDDEDWNFYFIGDGVEKIRLINEVKIRNLTNVRFIDSITLDEVSKLEFLRNPTIGLVPLKDNKSVAYLSPIKLYEYLRLGVPVLVSDSCSTFRMETGPEFVLKYYRANDFCSFTKVVSEFSSFPTEYYEAIRSGEYDDFLSRNTWTNRMSCLLEFIGERTNVN
jgi:glycosyltransferase involved in cell wall biosynthesis